MNLINKYIILPVFLVSVALPGQPDNYVSPEMFALNNLWILIAAFMVFIMHLGFSTLEIGLTRSKNSINILFKNVAILSIGITTYAFCGFNLMYPGDFNGIFGFSGFGLSVPDGSDGLINYSNGQYTYYSDFIFQAMFAATAATIVSGAVAERIKLTSFLLFSLLFVGFVYPWLGSWKWGGGWLDRLGFYDFAGSTIVHSVGGWGALIGAYMLGPRIGKYTKSGIKPIMGHNIPLAAVGVFLLWFGWYGFNGGSVLSADPELVSKVFVTTTLSAAAGIIGTIVMSWLVFKKFDLSIILNGSLAGLVGITAGADVVSLSSSCLIGFVSGIVVFSSIIFFDKVKLDDPVGAISVHLVCGVWGTIAVGIFSEYSLLTQIIGVLAYGSASASLAFLFFYFIKLGFGIRVERDEEIKGLDISEHEMESYSGFQIFTVE